MIAPEGGMFVLLDVRGTRLAAADFARRLLDSERVAVLPCDGFGPSAAGHLRIALSAPEARLRDAADRILRFARGLNLPPNEASRLARRDAGGFQECHVAMFVLCVELTAQLHAAHVQLIGCAVIERDENLAVGVDRLRIAAEHLLPILPGRVPPFCGLVDIPQIEPDRLPD